MISFQAESEIEENDNNLGLFDMRGSKKPQYWKFIKLIAPNNSKKKWKTSECVGAYCMKCELRLEYKPSNPTIIPRILDFGKVWCSAITLTSGTIASATSTRVNRCEP